MSAIGTPERRIALCMGTRPEIIKMAPVFRALRDLGRRPLVLHTGQHDALAWPLYSFFGMAPDHRIDLERTDTSLAQLSSRLIERIDRVLVDTQPAALVVHGDTSSAAMAALAAFYRRVPVAHVEAGLRSGQADDPFPEEKNREIVGRLARWHFAPTRAAVENLRREGVPPDAIRCVGNTIVDATRLAARYLGALAGADAQGLSPAIAPMVATAMCHELIVVTAHRRENWGEGIADVARAVARLAERNPRTCFAWPVHANPQVAATVRGVLGPLAERLGPRVMLTEPLDYATLVWLMQRATLILTDSGGIQEEAASLHVPVLVLRKTTERPEVIEAGLGRLVGTDPDEIVAQVESLLREPSQREAMRRAPNPFGDGRAGERIAAALVGDLRLVETPATLGLRAVVASIGLPASTA